MNRQAKFRAPQWLWSLALATGCGAESTGSEAADETGTETVGDGDGDPSTGDGDGDPSTGDGDGDPSTGDGDGDPAPVCGDGIVSGDEPCDDGNDDDFDACTATCEPSPALPGALTLEIAAIKQFELSWTAVAGATYYQILERADVDGEYVVVSDGIEAESVSLTVPLHLRLNASYKLRACNPEACSESEAVDVSGNLAEAVGYIKASDSESEYRFGGSLALSGDENTLAVAMSRGGVFVFVHEGGVWSQEGLVEPQTLDIEDLFGSSLALSGDGNTLAVGARGEDSNATEVNGDPSNDGAIEAGAAYVFVREGGAWSQEAYVKASNAQANDNFGHSVGLSADGNTLAVGAWGEASNATGVGSSQADNSASGAGAVYVFVREGVAWSQEAYVKASNTQTNDQFGRSLALAGDGNTLAVGAWWEDSNATEVNGDQADNSASFAGAVYVFVREGVVWSQEAYVKASNAEDNDQFGGSVALSGDGNTLAVGASEEESGATGVNGDQADNSVSLSGAAYVFAREGGAWSQQAYVKASNPGVDDRFGTGVALSGDGNTLAVSAAEEAGSATGVGGDGADDSASYSGAVYAFGREGGEWSFQAYVKASNTEGADEFGSGVALSGNGNTLAVGARAEDSNATGIGGDQADNSVENSGAVYLY